MTLMKHCASLKITKFSSSKNSHKENFHNIFLGILGMLLWNSQTGSQDQRWSELKQTDWKFCKDQKRIAAEQRHKDFENRNMFLVAERKLNSKHHDEYAAHYRSGDTRTFVSVNN